jgi:hypothetical protein
LSQDVGPAPEMHKGTGRTLRASEVSGGLYAELKASQRSQQRV